MEISIHLHKQNTKYIRTCVWKRKRGLYIDIQNRQVVHSPRSFMKYIFLACQKPASLANYWTTKLTILLQLAIALRIGNRSHAFIIHKYRHV